MNEIKHLLAAAIAAATGTSMVACAEGHGAPQSMAVTALPQTSMRASLRTQGEFPSLGGATEWLNSPPLTAHGLRGKVVLIDFWTYSCINWRRQLPYVRAWAEKYKSHGLVVIGVHAPEFEFEKNLGNVRLAAADMRIDYPIAVDNAHAVWRAFNNAYWPALYFIDAHGRVRHHRFGEGDYEKSERVIQQLLAEAGAVGVGSSLISVVGRDAEAVSD